MGGFAWGWNIIIWATAASGIENQLETYVHKEVMTDVQKESVISEGAV